MLQVQTLESLQIFNRPANIRTPTSAPNPTPTRSIRVSSQTLFISGSRSGGSGFTLIELLVVISMVAMLAALMAPALASSGTDSAAAKCLSNLRQVTAAWQMYADENRGILAYNEEGGTPPAWVYGVEDYSGAAFNFDTDYLLNPKYAQLGPYVKTAALFKCPSDMSLSAGASGVPRMRSYSMSQAIGYNSGGSSIGQGAWLPSSIYLCYFKQSDFGRPSPAGLWLLVEEHPDSINDGAFAFEMPASPAATQWVDTPAKYHANACNFSFADGHAETHAWANPQAIPNPAYTTSRVETNMLPLSNNTDIWWVGTRTSATLNGAANPFPAGAVRQK